MSVAKTTALPSNLLPSADSMARVSTFVISVPSTRLSFGSLPANCFGSSPIPKRGKTVSPRANKRKVSSNLRTVVESSFSKKTPRMKGFQNRSIMDGPNPSLTKASRVDRSSGIDLVERKPVRIIPTRILSKSAPMGFPSDMIPSIGWRNGSATR